MRRWPVIPAIVLVAVISTAFFGDSLAPHDPRDQNLRTRFIPPFWVDEGSFEHVLGTDHLGRDIFSRLLVGSRTSLMVAGIALSFGLLVGTASGIVAGYYGGMIDEIIMRLVDLWLALPFLLLALVVAVTIGGGTITVIWLLALSSWSAGARNVRGEVPISEGEGLRGAGQGGRSVRLADNPTPPVATGDSRGAGDYQHACGRTDHS